MRKRYEKGMKNDQKTYLATNSQSLASMTKKRRGPGRPFKPGQVTNPKGAPKRGTSWAEVIKVVSEMTPAQIMESLQGGPLFDQLRRMPQHLSMKYLVVIRWFVAQMNEPSPSLAGVIMDREDGKVAGDTGGAVTVVYVGRDRGWRPDKVIDVQEEPEQIESRAEKKS